MNQCTDQLVLALLPPKRIASVTWLSRDAGGSLMAAEAGRVAVNHGLAEEVLQQKPDLVVAGAFTTPALRGMLRRLGYPMLEVPPAGSIEEVRAITRQVAAALGEVRRGEALIARMDRQLADLARDPVPPVPVVAWDRTGFSAGEGTLYDAILSAAGARNLIRAPATLSYRKPDVELLLQADPVLLVQGSMDPGSASVSDDAIRHRLVERFWGERTLVIPQAYYICGTPMLGDAAVRLRQELHEAAASRPRPPIPASELSS
ncbi:ABC transporter substrate-binding protein [Novosphingobium sp. P6W]|uniref:ABC transporter substrate-binding protein n=1 Tax=Novosphingobium sp. P6W TaxID=1609758 RepID=UPI0013B3D4BE|nr:ABC transporter substrate-binding protein [Novosphingobium sp. P6W]